MFFLSHARECWYPSFRLVDGCEIRSLITLVVLEFINSVLFRN
jgi:hypothetical protein